MKLAVLAALVLAGCAFSNSVQKIGPDTYSVGAVGSPMCGGSACAETAALKEANQFCDAQGKEILVTNTSGGTATNMGHGKSNVIFRCLAKNDRELERPNLRAVPDVVIRDERR